VLLLYLLLLLLYLLLLLLGARPNHNLTLFLTCSFCLFLDWSNIYNVLFLLLSLSAVPMHETLFRVLLCLGAPPCQRRNAMFVLLQWEIWISELNLPIQTYIHTVYGSRSHATIARARVGAHTMQMVLGARSCHSNDPTTTTGGGGMCVLSG
jgi:hypothetical protein